MDCKEAKNLTKELLNNTLSSERQREMYYHLIKCKDCFRYVSDDYFLYSMLSEESTNKKSNYDGNFDDVLNKIYKKFSIIDFRTTIIYVLDTLVIWAIAFSIISLVGVYWHY
ncbi:MAG: hypothetical protein Q4F88_04505 [Eubacteriales bacterium]|nr:hypothetical protein [Eubacteriales bacterium]